MRAYAHWQVPGSIRHTEASLRAGIIMSRKFKTAGRAFGLIIAGCGNLALADAGSHHLLIIRAAHLIEVDSGKVVSPAEVLVEGERIVAAGASGRHPAGAESIDLGDATLLPGLIDA